MRKFLFSVTYTICVFLSTAHAQDENKHLFLIPKSPDALYLGAVLKKDALQSEEHKPIDLTINKKIPTYYQDIFLEVENVELSKVAYEAFIKKSMPELVRKNPVKQIYFKTHNISKKADLERVFGTKTDVTSWFAVDIDQAVGKHFLLLDFGVTYFDVFIDMLYEDWTKISSLKATDLDNHVFVGGMGYGKKFMILVESASSQKELRGIIENLIYDKPISAVDKTILANSSFHSLTFGKEVIAPNKENPVKPIVDYLKKPISQNDYGTPVYMVLYDLRGNQLYYNTIK